MATYQPNASVATTANASIANASNAPLIPTPLPTPQPSMASATTGAGNPLTGMPNTARIPDTTVVATNQIGTQPVKVPPATSTISTPGSFNVTAPQGTTTGTDGTATVPPPATDTTAAPETAMQKMLKQLGLSIDALGGKAAATQKLQEEQQLAEKTMQATQDYNAYNKAKLEQAQTIERMKTENPNGLFGGAQDQMINEYTARSNANLANLAVMAQSSQGLLTAAQQTIKDKIDAQFQPIQDNIDNLSKFYQLNQNDLTDSEKMQLQAKITEKADESKAVRETADKLHQAVIENGGGAAILGALDKVTQDYAAGKLTAAEAQGAYYKAAGQYGSTSKPGDGVPTVKSINGVDMQWNPATKSWETIGSTGMSQTDIKNLTTVNDVNNILSNPAFDSTFGVYQTLNRNFPGTDAYKLSSDVNNLLSNLALAARGQLKGQGQVSDFEGRMLRDAQTALKLNMNPIQARQELVKVKGAIMTSSGLEAPVKITAPDGTVKYGSADQAIITGAISSGYTVEYQ